MGKETTGTICELIIKNMTVEQYLTEHTLNAAFVKSLGWRWDEEKITIPYYDSERKLLHCRYRLMSGKPKFDADQGSEMALYALHKIKDKQVVVLCEGEIDCAKLWQEGIPATTAGGVSGFNAKLAPLLKDKDVIVLMDNDEHGRKVITKHYELLEKAGAIPRIGLYPEGVKDVCEYFAAGNTSEDFLNLINKSLTMDQWQEISKPENFNIISAKEILSMDIPEQEWFIEKMIPTEGFAMIIGAEGTGKSFYLLTMANAITTGDPWLGIFPVKQKTNVLFIDKENVMRRIQSRMKGLRIKGDGMFYLQYPQYFTLINEKTGDFSDFALYLKSFVDKNEIGAIMIDSFTDLMFGNENSAGEVQSFFDALRQLFPGKAVVLLHHANKPSQGMTRTASQKTRGSTNINAQAYSMFYVEKLPRANHEFSFEHIKAGDTDPIKKFKIEMEIHHDVYDKAKSQVIKLRFGGEIEDAEEKATQAEEVIVEILSSKEGIFKKDLKDICISKNISPSTFERVIKKMRDENIINSDNIGGGVKKTISLI